MRRAINRTKRFINSITKFKKLSTNGDSKSKKSAQIAIRKIVSSNKKKFQNINQIIHFNNIKIASLTKKLDLVLTRDKNSKIRYKFKAKPSLKSLRCDKIEPLQINKSKIDDYLKNLFSKKETTDSGLFQKWLNETTYPKQKLITLWRDNRFDEILKFSGTWKAAGLNGVYLTIYKNIPTAKEFLKKWLKAILNNQVSVTKFDISSKCFSIFKGGDVSELKNYRFINIQNSHTKILMKLINDLMMDHILPLIPLEQFANKPKKDGLLDAILMNRILQRTLSSQNSQTQQAWIDFQKAFDSISHSHLIQTWEKLGIDARIVSIMKQAMKYWSFTLTNSSEKINDNNREKPKRVWINMKRGIFQGDSSSPTNFIMMLIPLSYLLNLNSKIKISDSISLNHICFYDDIKLYAHKPEDLSNLCDIVEKYGQEVGLVTNKAKCSNSISPSSTITNDSVLVDYPDLKSTYKHLGILENQYGSNIDDNFNKLLDSFNKSMSEILQSPLNVGDMIKCINTCVIPKVLYLFSHEGSTEKRDKFAKKLDLLTREHLNKINLKLAALTNARLYLSKTKNGLGLKNVTLELDKINLKNFAHIHYNDLFKDLK
uniref:Reverse transcriptase domain-containing protein n=1 Tax=Strongyloides papillosus TaxID=174720 RepID=A0A0N5B5H6_STREA